MKQKIKGKKWLNEIEMWIKEWNWNRSSEKREFVEYTICGNRWKMDIRVATIYNKNIHTKSSKWYGKRNFPISVSNHRTYLYICIHNNSSIKIPTTIVRNEERKNKSESNEEEKGARVQHTMLTIWPISMQINFSQIEVNDNIHFARPLSLSFVDIHSIFGIDFLCRSIPSVPFSSTSNLSQPHSSFYILYSIFI